MTKEQDMYKQEKENFILRAHFFLTLLKPWFVGPHNRIIGFRPKFEQITYRNRKHQIRGNIDCKSDN